MKILQITPYFYPAWAYGGIPRVAYELSRELSRRGHDVTVYTTDVLDGGSRVEEKFADLEGVKVHYFKNLSNSLAYSLQLFLPSGLAAFLDETVRWFDVIHMHGHRHLLNNAARWSALKYSKPYVLTGHGTVVNIERRRALKAAFDVLFGSRVLKDASRLIAVSEAEARQFRDAGLGEDRTAVIHNGIDVDAFAALPEKGLFRKRHGLTGKKVILYLGKITPRKGIDFLVRAFVALGAGAKDSVLVIAGNDMGFKAKVVEIVRQGNLEDRVLFTGLLTGEDKLSAYADADLLVYPAIHEIFGLVPFEAMMCGAPVIVTDDCGCGEIIGREGIGYTVRYNDVDGLAARIREALGDRDEAARRTEKGRAYIKSELTWAKAAAAHERLYAEVAGRG